MRRRICDCLTLKSKIRPRKHMTPRTNVSYHRCVEIGYIRDTSREQSNILKMSGFIWNQHICDSYVADYERTSCENMAQTCRQPPKRCSAPTFEDDSLLFAQAVNIAHSLQHLDYGLAHRLAAADPDLSWKVRYRTLLSFFIQMIKLDKARSLLQYAKFL